MHAPTRRATADEGEAFPRLRLSQEMLITMEV